MLLADQIQNWPDVAGLAIMLFFLTVMFCGWPRIVIHRKCECRKTDA